MSERLVQFVRHCKDMVLVVCGSFTYKWLMETFDEALNKVNLEFV